MGNDRGTKNMREREREREREKERDEERQRGRENERQYGGKIRGGKREEKGEKEAGIGTSYD